MIFTDFQSFFQVLVDFLFSSTYSIFGIPLVIYLLIPVVMFFIVKILKRGRE